MMKYIISPIGREPAIRERLIRYFEQEGLLVDWGNTHIIIASYLSWDNMKSLVEIFNEQEGTVYDVGPHKYMHDVDLLEDPIKEGTKLMLKGCVPVVVGKRRAEKHSEHEGYSYDIHVCAYDVRGGPPNNSSWAIPAHKMKDRLTRDELQEQLLEIVRES